MDVARLMEQFLGADMARKAGDVAQSARSRLPQSLPQSIPGGSAGALAAGGVIGLLLGNKKARKTIGKLGGGAVKVGGAALLGALAYNAYRNWQAGKAPVAAGNADVAALPAPDGTAFDPVAGARDGGDFRLALIQAMIAAANADGHIDATEQAQIFEKVEALELDAAAKGLIFDLLRAPPGLADIAALPAGPEQAAELYLASRLAIDADHPAETAYVEALAARLGLAPALVAHLDAQVAAV